MTTSGLAIHRRALLRGLGASASAAGLGRVLPGCGAVSGARFDHGVAAGDPSTTGMVLWTRLSGVVEPTPVTWMVARDPSLEELLSVGTAVAEAQSDFTVHVEVEGLPVGSQVYYGFEVDTDAEGPLRSSVGKAKTLALDPSSARIGVCCCASLAHGYFHGYRFLAARELDFVLHLGDSIYEFASGEYGSVRSYEPPHKCVTLSDYRQRHAQYRRDPDAQTLRGAHALVPLWDDHEFVNDAFEDGSYFHDTVADGPWAARRDAARQAFLEWMPVRIDPAAPNRLYRRFSLGSLASIVCVDSRMDGRTIQPFEAADAYDPSRRILSGAQERWLNEQLSDTSVRYRVLAQQVLFAQHPEIYSLDAWDGYAIQRQRVLSKIAEEPSATLITLAGDSHASWASELSLTPFDPRTYDPNSGVGSIGVELGVPGISSPNYTLDEARLEEARILLASPHHRYTEQSSQGFLVLELDATSARAQHFFVDGVEERRGTERPGPVHEVLAGTSHFRR